MSGCGSHGLSRRHALCGVAALGVAVPTLVACGSGDSGSTGSDGSGESGDSGGSGGSGASGGTELGSTDDVPVDGGAIYPDSEVVVTQPTEGDFKGFTAVCTHSGCIVESVEDGTINCGCHGSQFSIEDGSVVTGPASEPLAEVQLTVKGSSITVA